MRLTGSLNHPRRCNYLVVFVVVVVVVFADFAVVRSNIVFLNSSIDHATDSFGHRIGFGRDSAHAGIPPAGATDGRSRAATAPPGRRDCASHSPIAQAETKYSRCAS